MPDHLWAVVTLKEIDKRADAIYCSSVMGHSATGLTDVSARMTARLRGGAIDGDAQENIDSLSGYVFGRVYL